MSLPVSSVRGMSNERRARRAKQVRRDERRAKKRNGESSADTTLRDALRRALAGGHPLSLLSMASMVIHVAKPEPLISLKSGRCDTSHLDGVLTGLIGVRNREMTALLAVIAELLVDDPAAQLRCRRELAERDEHLPRWIAALPRVDVYRAVRRTHVLGDVDELVIGMRLDGGRELTIAVQIDHNMLSSVADAGAVPDPIDEALARVAESSSDTHVFEMTWPMRGCGSRMRSRSPHSHLRPIRGRSTVDWFGGWSVGYPKVVNTGHRPESGSRTRSCATGSSLPVPQRRSPTPAIGSCCWSSSRLGPVTHCGGARRVSNRRSAARPTARTAFRWRSR